MMEEENTSLQDFKDRVQLAKLDPSDLQQPSLRLKFNDFASNDEYSLMQVNKEMLKLVEEGCPLVIRGEANDSAILCTDSATYDIKNASTSNTLVVFNDLLCRDTCASQSEELYPEDQALHVLDKEAIAWKFNYYELKQVNALTSRLTKLLNLAPFKGPQYEEEYSSDQLFTLSDFQNSIQASEVEIMQKLTEMDCCCISGKWRLLDFGYTVECMGEMLQLIEAESWSCGKVPVEEMCTKINDCGELVPEFIVKHLLSAYGSQFVGEDGTTYYELSERKVCRFFAEMLLKDVGRFNYSEFLSVWKESVPSGMIADDKFLEGLALVDKVAQQPAVFLFKAEDLPLDLDARFEMLFENREKWTLDQITPYIESVCLKGQSVPSLLTKYARSSTMNGKKVFSTRKLR